LAFVHGDLAVYPAAIAYVDLSKVIDPDTDTDPDPENQAGRETGRRRSRVSARAPKVEGNETGMRRKQR
jgi:hypothetical protein